MVSQASGATAPAGRRQWQWAVAVGSGWDDYCDHTVARNLEGKSAALPFRRPVAEGRRQLAVGSWNEVSQTRVQGSGNPKLCRELCR